jgi:hypothetical protein
MKRIAMQKIALIARASFRTMGLEVRILFIPGHFLNPFIDASSPFSSLLELKKKMSEVCDAISSDPGELLGIDSSID